MEESGEKTHTAIIIMRKNNGKRRRVITTG